MRIAVYHNLHSGGAKHSTYEIVRRLAERHRVALFCPGTADVNFFDLRQRVAETVVADFARGRLFRSPVGRLNQLVRWRDLARLEGVERRIAAEVDRGDYDVVYVHPCQFTQNPSILRFLKTPTLYHSREPFRRFYEPLRRHSQRNGRGWGARLDRVDPFIWLYHRRLQAMERHNIHFATRIVTNSYFTRESLYRIYGVDARVVYNGVDLETFRPLGLPKENVVVGVGALTPNKAFDFLVESLGLLPQSMRPELAIISNYQEVEERRYLEALAATHGVNLTLKTMVSEEELVRFYNIARCTLVSPVMEPFGLVALESMACGTPVVGVAEGGIRESVTHGVNGLLADRDTRRFAAAVRDLLEQPETAARYGSEGRHQVETRWRWERAVAELEDHLSEVAGSVTSTPYGERQR
jgi:glycosyltransferase involved in cell wall biosynthesis